MSLQTASFVPVLSTPHTVITHFHVMFFQYHNFDHSFCCYWLSCMTNFSDDWILKCLKKCIYVKMLCPPMEKKMRVCVCGGGIISVRSGITTPVLKRNCPLHCWLFQFLYCKTKDRGQHKDNKRIKTEKQRASWPLLSDVVLIWCVCAYVPCCQTGRSLYGR